MPNTHCLSSGSLAAHQLPVPGVPGMGAVYVPGVVDGVCVLMSGLGESATTVLQPTDSGGVIPSLMLTLKNDLVADNWTVLYCAYPESSYVTTGIAGIVDDVSNDSGHGSRYSTTRSLWWDHVVDWSVVQYPGKKIIVVGFSEGGYSAIDIASRKSSTIIGGIAHCPLTIWENVSPLFTPGYILSGYDFSGCDLSTTELDAFNQPFMVSYGTNDIAVGYDLAGTGGTPVSNTDSIITNAVNAGMPITRNATADNHEMTSTDVTTFMAYVTGTLDPLR